MGAGVPPRKGTLLYGARPRFRTVDVPNADPADFPAGKVFFYGDQPSTHLNTVIGEGDEYRVIPMLVPGQKNVEGLLKGEKATREQMDIAIQASKKYPKLYPAFPSVDAALAGEQAWRKKNIPRIEEMIRQMQGRE